MDKNAFDDEDVFGPHIIRLFFDTLKNVSRPLNVVIPHSFPHYTVTSIENV